MIAQDTSKIKCRLPKLVWHGIESVEHGPGRLIDADFCDGPVLIKCEEFLNRTGRDFRICSTSNVLDYPAVVAKWNEWLEICRRCDWSDGSWTCDRRIWSVYSPDGTCLFWSFFQFCAELYVELVGGGARVFQQLRPVVEYDAMRCTQTIVPEHALTPAGGSAA